MPWESDQHLPSYLLFLISSSFAPHFIHYLRLCHPISINVPKGESVFLLLYKFSSLLFISLFSSSSSSSSSSSAVWNDMKNKGCLSSAPPRPPPPVAVAECCMCGDYGLPNELFHCKVCLSRYQHKYCSDLYLKSEAYHTCNWCLREASSSSSSSKNNTTSSSHPCSSNNNINGGNTIKINRTSFSSNLHKPVKKQRFPQLLKARVRRYKLLEDVSS